MLTGETPVARIEPHRGRTHPVAATALRAALAALIAILAGIVELAASFSDLGPGESLGVRIAAVGAITILGGLLFALALPRAWVLGVLTSWGPVLLGALLLVQLLRGRAPAQAWLGVGLFLAGAPVLALAGSALGRAIVRRRPRTQP